MRWTTAGGVHRLDVHVAADETTGYRGTWTAVTDPELRAMLGWLQGAGLAIVPTGATAALAPKWPTGMAPALAPSQPARTP